MVQRPPCYDSPIDEKPGREILLPRWQVGQKPLQEIPNFTNVRANHLDIVAQLIFLRSAGCFHRVFGVQYRLLKLSMLFLLGSDLLNEVCANWIKRHYNSLLFCAFPPRHNSLPPCSDSSAAVRFLARSLPPRRPSCTAAGFFLFVFFSATCSHVITMFS